MHDFWLQLDFPFLFPFSCSFYFFLASPFSCSRQKYTNIKFVLSTLAVFTWGLVFEMVLLYVRKKNVNCFCSVYELLRSEFIPCFDYVNLLFLHWEASFLFVVVFFQGTGAYFGRFCCSQWLTRAGQRGQCLHFQDCIFSFHMVNIACI